MNIVIPSKLYLQLLHRKIVQVDITVLAGMIGRLSNVKMATAKPFPTENPQLD